MAIATLGSTVVGLVVKLGFGIIAVIALIILFFGSKFLRKYYKRKKTFKIQALVHNPDGTWYTDKIGKFKDVDGIDKMIFLESGETMPVLEPKYIRALQCELWRYAPGQYAGIPQSCWGKNPKNFGIDVINFQMKNFAFLEQRAAVSRWAYVKDLLQKWAPYITVLLCLVAGGVIAWFLIKLGLDVFNQSSAIRIAECAKLIGGGSSVVPH